MSVSPPPVTGAETRIVGPRESKVFVYRGYMIPNEVSVENLDSAHQADFILEAVLDGLPQWKLFGSIEPGQTVQLLVQWPVYARFTNPGQFDSSFRVSGNGIFASDDQ